jgi:hypothetical protein
MLSPLAQAQALGVAEVSEVDVLVVVPSFSSSSPRLRKIAFVGWAAVGGILTARTRRASYDSHN